MENINKKAKLAHGNIDRVIREKEFIERHEKKHGWVIPIYFDLLTKLSVPVDELAINDSDKLVIMQCMVGSTNNLAEGFPVKFRELAYLGDAVLTYIVAQICFERDDRPQDYQSTRQDLTSNATLCNIRDRLLSEIDPKLKSLLPVTSSGTNGEYSKATMLEAIIGGTHCIYGLNGASILCKKLIKFSDRSRVILSNDTE